MKAGGMEYIYNIYKPHHHHFLQYCRSIKHILLERKKIEMPQLLLLLKRIAKANDGTSRLTTTFHFFLC